MSMWREPKAYAAELGKLQQDDLLIARTDKHNYASGEPINFDVLLSHYGGRDLRGAMLECRLEPSEARQPVERRQPIPPRRVTRRVEHWPLDISSIEQVARASVSTLARKSFDAPTVLHPQRRRIVIKLHDAAGRLVAENAADVFVYPKPAPATQTALVFHDPSRALGLKEAQLKAAGYALLGSGVDTRTLDRPTLLIAPALDERVARHLRGGGRVLLLADSKGALPQDSPLKVVPREGSDLDGNWVTNFNWVRAGAPSPFAPLAFTKILGFESEHVVPRFVVQGVGGAGYDDVLAGVFYGWLNNNAALALQARAGRGRLVLTTLRFDEYGRDPYATHLLDALVRYASGPDCAPRFDLDAAALR
jgi:hypothetical protein